MQPNNKRTVIKDIKLNKNKNQKQFELVKHNMMDSELIANEELGSGLSFQKKFKFEYQ